MIIGHQKIIQNLERQVEKCCLAGSYLFSGPGRIGKKAVAFHFAEKILGFPAKNNPNVFMLSSSDSQGEIKIEETREFIRAMSFSGLGENKRIFLIDEAHLLNRQAQNALLKRLEEPREGNVIILISEDENRILPTIISRCQKIRFSLLGEGEMEAIYDTYPEDRKLLKFWSFGRPGLAISLVEDPNEREKLKNIFLEFRSLFNSNFSEKSRLAEKISQDRKELIRKLEIWMLFFRKAFLESDSPIKIPSESAFGLLRETEKSLETIKNTNSSARLALENLFLKF